MTKVLQVDLSSGASIVRDYTQDEIADREEAGIVESAYQADVALEQNDDKANKKLVKALKKSIKTYAQKLKNGQVLTATDLLNWLTDFLTEYDK